MKKRIGCFGLMLLVNLTYAQETSINPTPQYAEWTFSGIVKNEANESYHYYFRLQKNKDDYHSIASLVDATTKKLILYETGQAHLEPSNTTQWQVGSLFLTFNPITDTWLFGANKKQGKGFHLKIDMLGQTTSLSPKIYQLRSGIHYSIIQAQRLSGHLQTGLNNEDIFVTAQRSWFQRLWSSDTEITDDTVVRSILCEFNDGASFYTVTLQETNALHGAIAGWRNEEGAPSTISQFVSLSSENEKNWSIDISSPKLHLNVADILPSNDPSNLLVLGMTDTLPGFCSISAYRG